MARPKKHHLKKRPDGRYRCYYQGKYFYGLTEEEAYQAREDYKAAEDAGNIYRPDVTVQEYAVKWLPIARPAVSAGTYKGLAIHLEKLATALGNVPLAEVKPTQIREVFSTAYLGLSNKYILNAKQLYTEMFDSAVSDGICKLNPCREKAARPHKGTSGSHRAITKQERWWIENLCKEHRAHAAVMTMLWAGVRPQELKAMKVEDCVDFDNNVITLSEFVHVDGTQYKVTDQGKNDLATRQIPLLSPLRAVLEGRTGYIASSAKGELVSIRAWRCLWKSYKFEMEKAINGCEKRWYRRSRAHKAILREAQRLRDEGKEEEAKAKEREIPPWIAFTVVPYDLRHSYCTFLRDNGVELHTAIRWMGHSDATMILKIYDEVSDDRESEQIKNLEAALKARPND